jgi:hypothetical protein
MFPLVELKGSKIVKVERPWSLEEEEAVMDGNKINSGRKRRLFKYESRKATREPRVSHELVHERRDGRHCGNDSLEELQVNAKSELAPSFSSPINRVNSTPYKVAILQARWGSRNKRVRSAKSRDTEEHG